MSKPWIKWLFIIAGIYEAVLGLAFLIAPTAIFDAFGTTLPNHMGYVQFPALLLLVFALMFFRIASDPVRYRELMLYGMGLKISYCILAFYYQLAGGIPAMWMPWAWCDLAFLVLFFAAWRVTGPASAAA